METLLVVGLALITAGAFPLSRIISRALWIRRERLRAHNTLEQRTDDFESRLSEVEKLASEVHDTLERRTSRLSEVEKMATDLEEAKKAIRNLTDKFDQDLRDAKDSLKKEITKLTSRVAEQRPVVKELQDTPDLSDVEGSVNPLRRTQGEAE